MMTEKTVENARAGEPRLEHAFSALIEVGTPIELGTVDDAAERFIPIIGGKVDGPRLQGRILPAGGDWQTIRGDGRTELLARYFIETSDGAVVAIENPGIRTASPAVIERLRNGDEVLPGEYYSAGTPRFRVSAGSHEWLRRRLFVARGVRRPASLTIDFYTIE